MLVALSWLAIVLTGTSIRRPVIMGSIMANLKFSLRPILRLIHLDAAEGATRVVLARQLKRRKVWAWSWKMRWRLGSLKFVLIDTRQLKLFLRNFMPCIYNCEHTTGMSDTPPLFRSFTHFQPQHGIKGTSFISVYNLKILKLRKKQRGFERPKYMWYVVVLSLTRRGVAIACESRFKSFCWELARYEVFCSSKIF